MSELNKLKSELVRLEQQVAPLNVMIITIKSQIGHIQTRCQHRWGETKYTPEHTTAYTTPGDTPGTMGVDFRGPVQVPSRTTDLWTRVCEICGKTAVTNQSKITGRTGYFG